MTRPLVSVVVPTYNGSAFIEECLASVRAQTWTDFEVVVSDDGSTDDTLSRVQRFSDNRTRVIAGARAGAAANWNRGLEQARGRFVKVLCQDDRLHPEALQDQVTALEANPSAVLSSSARRVIDPRGHVVLSRVRATKADQVCGRDAVVHRCLKRGTNVLGEPSAVLFDRRPARAAGWFRECGYVTDLEFWLRLLEYGDAVLLATPRVDLRLHRASWSSALRATQRTETCDLLRGATADRRGMRRAHGLGLRVGGRFAARTLVTSAACVAARRSTGECAPGA